MLKRSNDIGQVSESGFIKSPYLTSLDAVSNCSADGLTVTGEFKNDDKDIKMKQFMTEFLNIKILEKIYDTIEIKNKHRRLEITLKNDQSHSNNYFGNPLYSLISYFEYFFTKNDDWLVTNNIDEKSTKFDLSDNTIIIEFRDFPFYMYLYMYITSNDSIRNDIIQNNIGTLNIKTIKDYMNFVKMN